MTRRLPFSLTILLVLAPTLVRAQAPGQVSSPVPVNGATDVSATTSLSWSPAANARGYDVRLGTTSPPPIVARNIKETTYRPLSPLQPGTTYYWQIDARGRGSVVTPGPLWRFTTAAPPPPPGAPSNPVPANGATDVSISASVSWAASAGATTYDVAFGTMNPPPVVTTAQAPNTFDPPGDLTYSTVYYWRVTAKGPGGSTAGPLWSFATEAAPPPPPPPADTLRLMTWNVKSGQDASGTLNVDSQVELMVDSGAHVIVLQEVTITTEADLPALYETKLEAMSGQPWNSVWAPAPRPSTTTPGGNLILTTLPIVSSSTLQIDSVPSDPTWLDTKRSAAQAAVVFNGATVNVFGTHLAVDATQRNSQVSTLQSWLATFSAPRVVGGDLNTVVGDAAYASLAQNFSDAWPALAGADEGFTMDRRASAGDQPGRIDYWWQEKTDTHARATEIWVVKTRRSDHHALIVDCRINP